MKKILTVFGTRPEAIKMAPVVKELEKHPDELSSIVCVTGQHREMLDQILNLFEIKPHYDLDIMKPGQDLFDISIRIMQGLKPILQEEKPDIVLVHGDTSTSIIASLSAFYLKVPVGHVEAGLRTHNKYSPFPEEINRQLTGRIANFHFCPTEKAKQNLLNENIAETTIHVTGNTVIDALHYATDRIEQNVSLQNAINDYLSQNLSLSFATLKVSPYILVTGHRRENFGEGIQNLCSAIKTIAEQHPEWRIVYPVHLNPNISKPVHQALGNINNVILSAPLDYLPFIHLMKHAKIILTDSGGIQEEAPGFGIPVLVTRDTTERPEAIDAGTAKLVGCSKENIISNIKHLINNDTEYHAMSTATNPYGDGKAAIRITKVLNAQLSAS